MEHKEILLELRHLKKFFPVTKGIFKKSKGVVKAVNDVNLTICKGETLGLIGESGCGKSTLARVIMGLTAPTDGVILYQNQPVDRKHMTQFRRKVQMIFQDPYSSLDPRMTIGNIIEEPLRIHTKLSKAEKNAAVLPLLEKVSIAEDSLKKYPHEFSGGQQQRIGIARALVLTPELMICDEPVSALDVSVQAQILNLFKKLQKEYGLTYLFVSHDMSVIRHVSDRIAVMYLGRIVELATKKEFFENTLHPYSAALMNAIPEPDPDAPVKKVRLKGELPSPLAPPPGCPFQTRCCKVMERCRAECPPLKEVRPDHFAACYLYDCEE